MSELIVDLKQSLISPDEDFVKVVDPDEESSTRTITDKDMAQIKRQTDRRDSMDDTMRLRKNSEYYHERERERYEEYEDEDEEDDEDEEEYYEENDDYDPKMERLTTFLAVVAALLIGGIIIFMVGRTFGMFNFGGSKEEPEQEEQVETVEMPPVAGKPLDDVKRELL